MIEAKRGVLSGWVVGAGPFAGFELTLDGKLTLRRAQDNASRALFAGSRALVLGDNGLAAETTDGGVEWQSVELPPEIDLKAAYGAGTRQGCTALGCGFAGFTRVGYFEGHAARSLASPATPPRVAFPGPGGSHWFLHCAATGDASPGALPFRPPTPLSGRRLRRSGGAPTPNEDPDLVPLSPFLNQAPPAFPDNFEGVDAGTEPYGVQLRAYAYGPRGGDWTRTGSLSFAFADRFQTKPGVHVSASARSPWPDSTTAADALGAEPSTSAAGLAAALDPSGTSGGLLARHARPIRVRGRTCAAAHPQRWSLGYGVALFRYCPHQSRRLHRFLRRKHARFQDLSGGGAGSAGGARSDRHSTTPGRKCRAGSERRRGCPWRVGAQYGLVCPPCGLRDLHGGRALRRHAGSARDHARALRPGDRGVLAHGCGRP